MAVETMVAIKCQELQVMTSQLYKVQAGFEEAQEKYNATLKLQEAEEI
jgi:hypothetical protein